MPVGPIPLPAGHFGVDQFNLDQPGSAAVTWEPVIALYNGAGYDPGIYVKYDATTWRQLPQTGSADLVCRMFIKDQTGAWRFARYGPPSYPASDQWVTVFVAQ